jgi:hypothetical protein
MCDLQSYGTLAYSLCIRQELFRCSKMLTKKKHGKCEEIAKNENDTMTDMIDDETAIA